MGPYITRFLAAAAFLYAHLLVAQEPPAPVAETQSAAKIREEFLSWRFGMFLHFNIATFNGQEWANYRLTVGSDSASG